MGIKVLTLEIFNRELCKIGTESYDWLCENEDVIEYDFRDNGDLFLDCDVENKPKQREKIIEFLEEFGESISAQQLRDDNSINHVLIY